ncbi:MAG: iron-sulfur cluster assembly accessory protein [Chlamydiota bacterium]|nr:iron-sulfur cluster assembly accessory protein [Chlamydiota bacterium]
MSVTLTDRAFEEVKRLMDKENKSNAYLRLGVTGGGCSGYSYALDFDQQIKENDVKIELKSLNILIAQDSFDYVKDCELDFKSSLMGGGFIFNNPNAKKTCGCGSSFNV